MNKLHLLPYQPRELMPAILSYSDLNFIFMSPKIDRDGFPSKVYTIRACEKPLLVMSGKDTPIVNFLENKGCAKLVTNNSVEEMAEWLRNITREELQAMGKKGLKTIEEHYSKEIVTGMYADLVDRLLR